MIDYLLENILFLQMVTQMRCGSGFESRSEFRITDPRIRIWKKYLQIPKTEIKQKIGVKRSQNLLLLEY
jgi:hypothetical protein